MDFVAAHSPDPHWTASHEQYRPFVLFHRTQAAAMVRLQESGPEAAIEEINHGLQRLRELFLARETAEQFDADDLVKHLVELKESLREEYKVGQTLAEQLAEAVAAEQYERAARLRDEIARRGAVR
jgi:excinuclease UvrABC helicase subunit UvrB